MSLSDRLRKDMFEAKMNGDVVRADILSMAMASLKNAQISVEEEMTHEDEVLVLRKEAKKLQDAIEMYTSGGNTDLAQKEQKQLDALSEYLPQLMSVQEVDKVVSDKIEQLGVSSVSEIGKVMGVVMKELKGKADGNVVSESVKRLLSK